MAKKNNDDAFKFTMDEFDELESIKGRYERFWSDSGITGGMLRDMILVNRAYLDGVDDLNAPGMYPLMVGNNMAMVAFLAISLEIPKETFVRMCAQMYDQVNYTLHQDVDEDEEGETA